MQATSDFVRRTCSIFFVPFLFFFLIGCWVVFWVISAIYVYSVGEVQRGEDYPVADIEWNTTTRYVWIYHLFGLFWISAFIIGMAQFVIAVATCTWYFSEGGVDDAKGKGSISLGFYWVFRYHLGSIAFGALIIAIV